jgi:transposase-like protein
LDRIGIKRKRGIDMQIDGLEMNSIEGGRRKRKKLTAQEKWQIFLETSAKGAPVGEILRRYGLYSSELTKIRKQAESGALKELGRSKYSKRLQQVPYEEYERLKAELTAKEKALAQMSEEYLLLKKRTD